MFLSSLILHCSPYCLLLCFFAVWPQVAFGRGLCSGAICRDRSSCHESSSEIGAGLMQKTVMSTGRSTGGWPRAVAELEDVATAHASHAEHAAAQRASTAAWASRSAWLETVRQKAAVAGDAIMRVAMTQRVAARDVPYPGIRDLSKKDVTLPAPERNILICSVVIGVSVLGFAAFVILGVHRVDLVQLQEDSSDKPSTVHKYEKQTPNLWLKGPGFQASPRQDSLPRPRPRPSPHVITCSEGLRGVHPTWSNQPPRPQPLRVFPWSKQPPPGPGAAAAAGPVLPPPTAPQAVPAPTGGRIPKHLCPALVVPEGHECQLSLPSLADFRVPPYNSVTFDVLDLGGRPVLKAEYVRPAWREEDPPQAGGQPMLALRAAVATPGQTEPGALIASCRAVFEPDGSWSVVILDARGEVFCKLTREALARASVAQGKAVPITGAAPLRPCCMLADNQSALELLLDGDVAKHPVSIVNERHELLADCAPLPAPADDRAQCRLRVLPGVDVGLVLCWLFGACQLLEAAPPVEHS